MGNKLTPEEIGQHVIDNPSTGFDQCSVCQGVETQNSMKSLDENSDDFDLICDECSDTKSKDSPLVEWEVPILRTGWSHKTIKVTARTEQEAVNIAIDEAGGESFSESDAEYSAADGAHKL